MKTDIIARSSITINASKTIVWKALTDPDLIKLYFFGTEASSEWKVGSSIKFRGEWEGTKYEDKGTILEMQPENLFKYNYWSSFSELEDKPENYAHITYELSDVGNSTIVTVTQDNIASEIERDNSKKNWETVLNNMKDLIENVKAAV